LAKAAINQGTETDLRTGLQIEAQGVAICFSTHDQKEGVQAFLEKRKAVFEGR
jgi:enoyl-CoA hydratase